MSPPPGVPGPGRLRKTRRELLIGVGLGVGFCLLYFFVREPAPAKIGPALIGLAAIGLTALLFGILPPTAQRKALPVVSAVWLALIAFLLWAHSDPLALSRLLSRF